VRDPGRTSTRVIVDVSEFGTETGSGSGKDAIGADCETVRVGVRTGTVAVVEPSRVAGAYCAGIVLGWMGQGRRGGTRTNSYCCYRGRARTSN
jgi:hypothetical protein